MMQLQIRILRTAAAGWLPIAVLACLPLPAMAQQAPPSPDAAAMRMFATAPEISTLIAKARAERKPDQPNFVQPVVRLSPYTVNLEYRAAGVNAPASIHEREAELFVVVEGSGTAVTGGTLREEKRTNAENLSGSGIDGGESRRIGKGDVLFVPEKTAHWFSPFDGALVLLSLHVPRAATP